MPEQLLKAKFRGQQVPGSFKKGLNHNLLFKTFSDPDGSCGIEVETTTLPSIYKEYKSVYEFFDNWTDIKPR